jgi:hypothetical protein
MTRLLLPLLVILLAAAPAPVAPTDPPIDEYRAYVSAIRSGSVDEVLKHVEPVPESCKKLVRVTAEVMVAIEAVKTEMAKQMGPPKEDEEGWNMGQRSDEALKTLHGKPAGEGKVKVFVNDSLDPKSDFDIALMVRHETKWVVSAGTVLGDDPTEPFVEPPADERERLLVLADAGTRSAKEVLERLKKKEFKSPTDVQEAIIHGLTTNPK